MKTFFKRLFIFLLDHCAWCLEWHSNPKIRGKGYPVKWPKGLK